MTFRNILTGLLFFTASLASAETLSFEVDETVLVIRGRDSGGDARYEILAPLDARLQCIALDKDGTPIALDTTSGQLGFVRFDDISTTAIDRVVCRRM